VDRRRGDDAAEWARLLAVRHLRHNLVPMAAAVEDEERAVAAAAGEAAAAAAMADDDDNEEGEQGGGVKKSKTHQPTQSTKKAVYTLPDGTSLDCHFALPPPLGVNGSGGSGLSSSSSSLSPPPSPPPPSSSFHALKGLVASLYFDPSPLCALKLAPPLVQDHTGSGAIIGVASGSRITTPLPRLVSHCTHPFDKELQSQLYRSVVLCGGHSKLLADTDLPQRLKERLALSAPPRPASLKPTAAAQQQSAAHWDSVQVCCAPARYRGNEAWLGGSIVASLAMSMRDISVTKQEYEEHGATILNKKCP